MVLIALLCFIAAFMAGYGVIKHFQWWRESRDRVLRLSKCRLERECYKAVAERYINIGGLIFSGAGKDMLKEVKRAEQLARKNKTESPTDE